MISPFHSFVLPGLEQQKQQVQQVILQSKTSGLERSQLADKDLRKTGLGSKFKYYSHYYPAPKVNSKP